MNRVCTGMEVHAAYSDWKVETTRTGTSFPVLKCCKLSRSAMERVNVANGFMFLMIF